jgi:hypothetical protein
LCQGGLLKKELFQFGFLSIQKLVVGQYNDLKLLCQLWGEMVSISARDQENCEFVAFQGKLV